MDRILACMYALNAPSAQQSASPPATSVHQKTHTQHTRACRHKAPMLCCLHPLMETEDGGVNVVVKDAVELTLKKAWW